MREVFKTLKNIITGRKQVSQQTKLEAVSIGITIVHAVMFVMFIHFNVWPMIIYNGVVVVYYLYVLRIVYTGSILAGYFMTFAEIAVQVIFGTFMLGWDVGFFMYVFAIIPLFFYLNLYNDDVSRGVYTPLISTAVAVAVFVASYLVSIFYSPRFELTRNHIQVLFLYNSLLAILLLATMSHFFIIERRFSLISMTERNNKLDIEANNDPLTGLTNRRCMEKHLDSAMGKAKNGGSVFSLIMGDIDYFKMVNDTYGHDFGDEALKAVADILRDSVGKEDVVCRWGGEEFLLLVGGSENGACRMAENIRKRIESNILVHDETEIKFTMTFGVATYVPACTVEKIIAQADDNLYYGKRNGRNQVVSGTHNHE